MNKSVNSPKCSLIDSAKKNKSIRTNSISKSLLTPCRRVGLSVRRRTPQSKEKLLENTVNSAEVHCNKGIKPGEVKSYQEKVCVQTVNEKKVKTSKREKVPSKSKCTKIENRFEAKENIETDLKEDEVTVNTCSIILNEVKAKSSNTVTDNKTVENLHEKDLDKKKINPAAKESRKVFVQRQPTNESLINIENSQATQISNSSSQASKRSRKSLLATKITYSQDTESDTKSDDDCEDFHLLGNLKKLKYDSDMTTSYMDTSMTKECTVEVKQMSQNDLSQILQRKTRRRVNIIVDSSDEDDDFQTSQKSAKSKKPTATVRTLEDVKEEVIYINTDGNNLEKKIATLKFDIQMKQQKIAELEQSEIYKKKHDFNELKILTHQWKVGCQQALNDLLPLVRENTGQDIDMTGLLNQMQIPSAFIGYNVDENCFM